MKWAVLFITLALCVALCAGCTPRSATVTTEKPGAEPPTELPTEPPTTEITPPEVAQADGVGQEVVYVGTAVNAKLAPAVDSDRGLVYCIEMEEWPEEVLGKTVEVRGVLEQTDQFKAEVAPDGAISQGTAGGDLLLHGVTYEVK